MAVDLNTGDTSLPSHFLPEEEDHDVLLSHSHGNNNNNCNDSNNESALKPLAHSTEVRKDEDFIAELTHHMDRFLLQDDDKFDFLGIGSHNSELSWDLMGSPQSTLWSPLASNQGSPEGSSQEPSPPPTPGTHDVTGMFDMMKIDERGNSKYHTNHEIQRFTSSNIGFCSYQSLIQEQIRKIELSRLKQEQLLSLKQNLSAYGVSQGQMSQQSEPIEQIHEPQRKGKGGGVGRRTRPPKPAPLQQQSGAGMRALFLGGSGSRGGTGVFFPRGGTTAPPESTKKQGKGCSTVLIPARVVQALQQHFDQMAGTSGSKAGGFPPLHDVLVSNRDGMYSLQKRQSRKDQASIQNELILPQEWTY